jgi:hypothetical protein
MFRHPKYYKELRERNNSDQSISLSPGDGQVGRSTGPGQNHQAPSTKPQASSTKLLKQQAASVKPQA